MKRLKEIRVKAIDLEELGIAIVYTNTHDLAERAECKVNARQIAALPDLIEALRRCKFDSLNMPLEDLAFCRAAYAKATGADQ